MKIKCVYMKLSKDEYWNLLLDVLPEFKKLNHFVQDNIIKKEQGIPYLKIKNINFLHDYLLTVSERFQLIMLSTHKLLEIEKRKKFSQSFSQIVDFEDTFEATYHFSSFVSFIMSFLNSLAWTIKIVYDLNIKRNDIEFRQSKKLIDYLKDIDQELYKYILSSFDWIDELIRFRDVLHHRQQIEFLLVMDDYSHDNRIYIPSDPELFIWKYTNNRFETDLEFGSRIDEIKKRKGDLIQPLIPFIDEKMKKLIELTNLICKCLHHKLTSTY